MEIVKYEDRMMRIPELADMSGMSAHVIREFTRNTQFRSFPLRTYVMSVQPYVKWSDFEAFMDHWFGPAGELRGEYKFREHKGLPAPKPVSSGRRRGRPKKGSAPAACGEGAAS